MTVRPMNLDTDFPMVCDWWKARNAPALPKPIFLPADGFVAEDSGAPVAACWLFVANGTRGGIGLLEFTTTNPRSLPRRAVEAVKALYSHVEQVALLRQCASLLSFVEDGKGEQHLMEKMGWQDSAGVNHRIYAKALCQ